MFKSMLEAFLNLFKPLHTGGYPAKEIVLPDGYRGLIEYDGEACIYCDKCEKVCPPGAILFYQQENGEKKYRYNPWLCIYCGECVRACPKPQEALWQSETKQQPALKEEGVNEQWFVWEAACQNSREAYTTAKKAAKTGTNEK
ncbi:MAG: 4Fe-4S dicluster domain-containing protein [Sulfuricurvum sp.]|uniref:4Fe-4S dicluster domain-containing protein n=1 Tax=Sulfuricurvum sp. TaxID=2025608 RepID=UPI0025F18875|nr:4Fe-4S dicluster domain-containing protein [Sulfuricurvum sp.]MCK9374268.1 4Fe-4S dicluster domain-containing protein [Sulfuricurvum sp.]